MILLNLNLLSENCKNNTLTALWYSLFGVFYKKHLLVRFHFAYSNTEFITKQPCYVEEPYLSIKNHVKYFQQDRQEELSTSERGDFDYSLNNLSG